MKLEIDRSKPVQVYRNLNKPGCLFSVRQGGRVRGYVDQIVLQDATFKHATPKQLAAVRSGPRQVCQWISGIVADVSICLLALDPALRVSCDPKKSDGFTRDGIRIDSASLVAITNRGVFAAN